ncbi:MAG: N-acetylmuramoyl-L-alanine amidase [Lachnospiraceae bacterium]|nr:N-acetylmuramoyl-L-alanine amidase [Lachnospiraceae bacterium]
MRHLKHNKRLIPACAVLFCFLAALFMLSQSPLLPTAGGRIRGREADYTVVIDPGHGGIDPGKVSASGVEEKELNLAIALRLRRLLEAQDIAVVMTRTDDVIEAQNVESNKKQADLDYRIDLINDTAPDLVVSIHQNSFPDPQVYGAQVFYHGKDKESQALSQILKDQIVEGTDQTKIRDIKGNESYYLLQKSTPPTTIVECGFLSNPEETKLLLSPIYQEKMAWSIHMGILLYLNHPSLSDSPL